MSIRRGSLRKSCFAIVAILFLLLGNAHLAYAQAYVPVKDEELIDEFKAYVIKIQKQLNDIFGGTPNGASDSIRDLISGRDPGGIAKAPCAAGNNPQHNIFGVSPGPYPAYPYPEKDQPWTMALSDTENSIPNGVPKGATKDGPYVQVNASQSLRCLLIEITEWQKLGISVQIHALLREYISNSQQAQLTKQLKNRIAAANLQFAKSGNQVNNDGVESTAPIFVTSYNQNLYNVKGRQIDAISDQAAADPASGNPQGSLGICQPWRVDAAANMARNNRTNTEDPYKYTDSATKCSLTDPNTGNFANEADYNSFQDNFNDPSTVAGGYAAYLDMINNPQNTPLGSQVLLDQAAEGRVERQEKSSEAEAANSGFLPTKKCSGDAADPHCLDDQYSLAANPSAQNEGNITNLTEQMNNEVTSDMVDGQSASSSVRTPSDINTNTGLLAADTLPLETSGTVVNRLIQEFYDVIENGYFGIHANTTQWAQGTMLMIYDEMKFSADLTGGASATVVTEGTDPEPTTY